MSRLPRRPSALKGRAPHRLTRPWLELLEDRLAPNAAPLAPGITLPARDGVIINFANVQLETAFFQDPDPASTPDGQHRATDWLLYDQDRGGELVWQFLNATGQERIHTDLGDGTFLGSYAGFREALPNTNYLLRVRHRDGSDDPATEYSPFSERTFLTSTVLPGDPDNRWTALAGYRVDVVATGFQLPVNIAFLPNAGTAPTDPYYYVTELYGTIKTVSRNGTVSDYATGLLNFNPTGAFPGSGEQGLTGIVVDPATGDVYVTLVYSQVPFDDAAPHYPRVVRFTSTDGGRTAATQTTVWDPATLPGFQANLESQGQSHQISHISFGPDGYLYVHNGEGFDVARAQNLNSSGGKVLRMTKDGQAVAGNPFYDAADGITVRDYVYAYGLRNPFGGDWRADGTHFIAENGPETNDRLSQLVAGRNYLWNGTAASMTNFALYNWNPPQAPTNIAFVQPQTFGGSGFPAEVQGRLYAALSGPTYGLGPQTNGKRIQEFTLNADGTLVGGPRTLVEYTGVGRASVSALAAGPDGLYFSDLYRDDGVGGPIARGANILRVTFIGAGAANFTTRVLERVTTSTPIYFQDTSSLPDGITDWTWDFGDGVFSTEQNPTHVYTRPGVYTVRLTVSNATTLREVIKSNYVAVEQAGLRAEYFNNLTLAGEPRLVRIDPDVNGDYGGDSPIPGVIGVDNFSVRWTGLVRAPEAGTYTFTTRTDDGVRLWVNGRLLVDRWVDQGPTRWSGTLDLEGGVDYEIKLEFYERGGGAVAQLFWTRPGAAEEAVPTSVLSPIPESYALRPPVGLTGPANAVGRVTLTWQDNSDNEQGFRILRSTDGVNFVGVAGVPAGTTTFTDEPGALGTYFYRVVAANSAFQSAPSNTLQVNVVAALPPSSLRVTASTSTAVTLAWNDNSTNETGFEVERAPTGSTAFVRVGAVGPNVTTFSDTPPAPGQYTYRVRAVSAEGPSPYSNTINALFQLGARPVAHWRFDETTGTQAVDTAGGDDNGTLVNGVVRTSAAQGRFGPALQFTPNLAGGPQQHVVVANADRLNPTSAITIAAWVNADNWNGNRRILQKGNNDNQYRLLAEGGVLKFDLAGVGTVTTALPSTGVWHHIAGTYDGGVMRLYVDGVERASLIATGGIAVTGDPLYIGTKNAGAPQQDVFAGRLDDVRLYDQALSANEILLLQNWTQHDVGGVSLPGGVVFTPGATAAADTYTIRASGDDIWNNADEFHFVYRALSGNGEIVARVVSLEQTDFWAKAGVMIRETLEANSRHASMFITPADNRRAPFQRRTATGGGSSSDDGAQDFPAPHWVRLVREGDVIRGFRSADGVNWAQVGGDLTLAGLPNTVYVGLAVTSHNDTVLTTAVFDNVRVVEVPVPPAPGLVRAAATSATQVTVSWADNSGNEDGFRVERSADGTTFAEVGSVAANVTTFADTIPAAGVYFYRVRAFNASGNSSYSGAFRLDTAAGATTLDYSGGFVSTGDLTRNGGAAFVGTNAQLTDGNTDGQAGSVFHNNRVRVTSFTTEFTFQIRPGTDNMADGFMFVIQGNGPNTLGPSGGGLGFGPDTPGGAPGIPNSVGVKFDIYQNATGDVSDNMTGLFRNGEAPVGGTNLNGTGIDLRSQRVFRVNMSYDGTTLSVIITDTQLGASTTQNYTVDIPAAVGGNTAFVGFTGATGGLRAIHEIRTWLYEAT